MPGVSRSGVLVAEVGFVLAELLIAANRSELPADFEPNIGDTLMMQGGEDGPPAPVIITAMDDTTVSLDANHRLAGKDLVFELELVAIRD